MKKLFFLLSLFLSSIEAIDYFPSKETLRRIFYCIINRQHGLYISFSENEISLLENYQNTNPEIISLLESKNPRIYKAIPYPSKGALIGKKIMIEEIDIKCTHIAQKVCKYMGGTREHNFEPQLYAHEPLAVLAQYDHDMHYCARFIWALRNMASICITQSPVSEESKQELFGNNCLYINSSEFDIDALEKKISSSIPNHYSVIIYEGTEKEHIAAKRIFAKHTNVFLFDLGNFTKILNGKKTEYDIDINKLKKMLKRHVVVFYGSALINHNYDFRKNEYIQSMNVLNDFWFAPFVAEAIQKGPSFLENGSTRVCYTLVNNNSYHNKGANEALSFKKAYEYFDFDDESMIVKLTGRYLFKSDSFLRLIESTDYDCYASFDPRGIGLLDITTTAFAIKGKHFRSLVNSLDPIKMEAEKKGIERLVFEFIFNLGNNLSAHVLYVDDMDLKAYVMQTYHYEF